MKGTVAAVLLVIALFPGRGVCQSARLGIGAGFGTLTGDDFENSEAGFTVGGNLLFLRPNGIQLGLAFDYSQYGVGDVDLNGIVLESGEEPVTQLDILGVLRYVFPDEAAQFFLGGKAGFSRRSAEVSIIESSSSGLAVGPMAGVQVPVGNLALEIGLDAMFVSYGDVEIDGTKITGTDATGFRILGRVGLSIPLGG